MFSVFITACTKKRDDNEKDGVEKKQYIYIISLRKFRALYIFSFSEKEGNFAEKKKSADKKEGT